MRVIPIILDLATGVEYGRVHNAKNKKEAEKQFRKDYGYSDYDIVHVRVER